MSSDADDMIDSFPAAWLPLCKTLPQHLTVNVAGYAVKVPLTQDDLTRVYLPVLSILSTAADQAEDTSPVRRVVAGLAGIPGSGKSTFAAVVALLADMILGMRRLISAGMDGWHWPNSVLDVRTTIDETGTVIPLRQRKGGPDSFDIETMQRAVSELQLARHPVFLPIYDRRRHDPVADGIHVGPGTRIVLIEGNYLLSDQPPWSMVSDILTPKLFIEADPNLACERVIERHIRGGLAPADALHKYETNDRLNTDLVLATAANANYTIRLSHSVASACRSAVKKRS